MEFHGDAYNTMTLQYNFHALTLPLWTVMDFHDTVMGLLRALMTSQCLPWHYHGFSWH